MCYDLIVIGGGPAGLASAYEAKKQGVEKILIIERDKELGGILNQCIHNGFGLHTFKEELTGPEYAERFIDMINATDIEVKLDTMVLEIDNEKNVHVINTIDGYMILKAKSIILSMGCRERTRGAIAIPGDRPSGVLTAGAAQRYINMEGYMPGKEVLILGSGDIGLIMARRMTLEGAKVKGVIELMPYSNGLNRNIVQCLNDYNIPLYLSHTVTDIIGRDRLEKVIIAKVDKKGKIIKGTEIEFDVDTLLLSVGLIPENELSTKAGIDKDIRTNGLIVSESMETSIRGVFACGNVLHVHDLVDFVTEEAKRAGRSVAKYLRNELDYSNYLHVKNGKSIKYVIPQKINIQAIEDNLTMLMRVDNIYHNKKIVVKCDETVIAQFNRKHLAPSEMEKVIISKSIIEKVKGDLVVSLEDGE